MVGITYKTAQAEIRRQQALSRSLADGQTAISTGKTLTKPSDNALAWVQLSDVSRQQSQQAAWQSNVSVGTTRASTAESNLEEMNTLLTRAQEIITAARNGSLNDTSRAAYTEEMGTIRTTINELLNQKDYQGVPVFDDGQSVLVPLSRGLNLAVVGTRQEISDGIDVNGTAMSLDQMLAQAHSAMQSGTDQDLSDALDVMVVGQNHVILQQTKQGVRSDRLDVIGERLTNTDLDLAERKEGLEATDLPTVISNVKQQLLQLEAAQTTFARINQQTLFDLIR